MATSVDNVFSSLFQYYSATSLSHFELKEFVEVLDANQLIVSKSTNSIQELLGHVHSNLTTFKHRLSGLQLLKVIISQCSTEVFQQNAERWLRMLLQIIQGHCNAHVYRLSLQLICEIFDHSKNFSDVSRLIVTDVIQELVSTLLTPTDTKMTVDALSCINKCIQTYPGPVGPCKGKIETLVYEQLSNGSKSKVVYQCFALLCQCGPSGSKGIKHSDNWFNHCTELLGSLENTLDSLYDGFEPDISRSKENEACLPLPKIPLDQEETSRICALKTRWITLCGCLEALLSEEMEATARVPVDRVIKLACRALSVNSKMVLSKPTSERVLLASLLTEIHLAVLEVLETFIVCCRKFLLPFTSVITGLFSQELLWTKTQNSGFNMTYSVLRQKIYEVLTVWLKVLDGCAAVSVESKTWIEQIVHDCNPYTESLLLNSAIGQSSKNEDLPRKKTKKRGYQEISQGISSQRKIHKDANSKLVEAGLEALYWLVTSSGTVLDRKPVQAVQSFTIKTLMSVQQRGERQTPIPYSVPSCRKSLYRVLQACVICPHPQAPPPTQCAVRIFSQGQRDKCLEVSSFCTEAMKICEVVLHPRAPVLNGPIICENVVRIEPTESQIYSNGDNTDNLSKTSTSKEIADHSTNGSVRVNGSISIANKSESRDTFKRPNDTLGPSDRSKFMKIQSDKSDKKDDVSERNLLVKASKSEENDHSSPKNNDSEEMDHSETEHFMEDETEANTESDEDMGDNNIENENVPDKTKEFYIATKYSQPEDVFEKSEDAEVKELKTGEDDGSMENDCIEEVPAGRTEDVADKDSPEEKDIAETQDAEVTAMMLSFVDADPDED